MKTANRFGAARFGAARFGAMRNVAVRSLKAILIAAIVGQAAPALARSHDPRGRLHVDVDEAGGDRVRITVPVCLARAAITVFADDDIGMSDEVSVEELRSLWEEAKKSGERELVRVEDDD